MNYKVVIDAGHGGEDSGATGNGIVEKDLTLLISNYIYQRLKELGIPTETTRTTDITLSPTDRVNSILSKFGNNSNVIVVSNHINAGGGEGAEIIYALRNNSNLSDKIASNLEDAGQNVRKTYQRRLPSDTSKDYYFIHRDTVNTQPIIVEYGFLDNTNDSNKLKNNWKKYAEAVVKGIAEYTNTPYNKIDTDNNIYIVKSGDTLYSIAKKYGIKVDELKAYNNLTSNMLSINQKLMIPNNDNYITYIIKKGDTLYAISKKYNVSIEEIMKYNNLTTNLLNVGKIIKIPLSNKTYVVKKGDTLYSIAKNNNTTVDDIKFKNNLTSNILTIGKTLNI